MTDERDRETAEDAVGAAPAATSVRDAEAENASLPAPEPLGMAHGLAEERGGEASAEAAPAPEALELVVALEPSVEEERAAEGPTGAADGAAVERFIAELPPAPADLLAYVEDVLDDDDDEPTRAFTPNRLRTEPPPSGSRSLPPTPPASARSMLPPPAAVDERVVMLPNVVLGPSLSMRADPTERIGLLPRTHPLANSIAPGGSAVSMPPRAAGPRGLPVLVAAALLLGLGTGGALLLSSRGEQHAASQMARRMPVERWPEDEIAARPAALSDAPPPPTVEASAVSALPEPAAKLAAAPALADPAVRMGAAIPKAARLAVPAHVDERALTTARPVAARPVQVALGDARLRPGAARPAPLSAGASRDRVMTALAAMHDRVRACVGDAHGVADVVLTVRGSGIVAHALVEGTFAGSPAGSCIARTLRNARLPRLAEPSVKILYPFQL